jgi:predicted nucleic acid-binding protein
MNGLTKICFDTCAAVNLEQNNRPINDIIAAFKGAELYMSVIARTEFMSKRVMTPEEKARRREFLSKVQPVPYLLPIEEETICLRRATRLKLPDAIIAATAIKIGAVLLTADDHFKNIDWPGLSVEYIT